LFEIFHEVVEPLDSSTAEVDVESVSVDVSFVVKRMMPEEVAHVFNPGHGQ